MLEAELQKQVLKWFDYQMGYFVWRSYVGPIIRGKRKILSPNPMAGFPDIFGFNPQNRPFAIELKSQTGTLSDKQKKWIKNLEANGVYCVVARDLDWVISEMDNLSLCK